MIVDGVFTNGKYNTVPVSITPPLSRSKCCYSARTRSHNPVSELALHLTSPCVFDGICPLRGGISVHIPSLLPQPPTTFSTGIAT